MSQNKDAHACFYCGEGIDQEEIDWAKSKGFDGYYCDFCEYKHTFNKKRPKYTLYLEEKTSVNPVLNKNKKSMLKKRLSPLRYPGGKSKLIAFIEEELNKNQLKTIISPFTGGGSVELALIESNYTEKLIINDKDPDVYGFWLTAFECTDALIDMVEQTPITKILYETAHDYMLGNKTETNQIKKAFYFLINNRCSFSGIYNAGRMGGKNGSLSELTARYNPKTIVKQLLKLKEIKENPKKTIEIHNKSYEEIFELYMWEENATFFIDPPYITEQASSIYKHSFNDAHHRYLFTFLNHMYHSYPNSDILVFYDNHKRITEFDIPTDTRVINRRYSIKQ